MFRVVTAPTGSLLIAGSIATDHLMTFGGKFADSLVVDQLDKLSVSFLVNDLEIRRGGVAPNMCFGLARLGLRPVLVGAAGEDFTDYRSWLERHGVDCESVHISESKHTARFVCTTDASMAQFASFYPGAMSESRLIELKPIADRVGAPTYVLIAADDPDGMLRHTQECRQRGYPFIADPSQQLAFSDGVLTLDAGSGDEAQASESVEATIEGEDITTGFNPQFLLDGLTAIEENVVELAFTQAGKPVVMSGKGDDDNNGFRYLLMPRRLLS